MTTRWKRISMGVAKVNSPQGRRVSPNSILYGTRAVVSRARSAFEKVPGKTDSGSLRRSVIPFVP